MRWQRVIITIILSPLLLVLIVPSVPALLVAPFLPTRRQETVLSILDRYITCIMALAGLDSRSPPDEARYGQADHDGSSSANKAAGTPDDEGGQEPKANVATPAQQLSRSDRTGILVALWIGVVTCFGVFVAAALAHGALRVAGMFFGAIAAGITALWLIRTLAG